MGKERDNFNPERRKFLRLVLCAGAGLTAHAITKGLPILADALEEATKPNDANSQNPKHQEEVSVSKGGENEETPLHEKEKNGRIAPAFTKSVQYWNDSIQRWAATAGLDPDLVATVMQIESGGNPDAISPSGALGLFQVMPLNFPENVRNNNERMLNSELNAEVATKMLKKLLEKTNDVKLALAAYNGGNVVLENPDNPEKWPAETQRYFKWANIYFEVKQNPNESPTLQEWLAAGGASLCKQAEERLGLNQE